MKKVFSLLLVLIMSFMIFSVCAYAAPEDPFFISEDEFNMLVEEGKIPSCVTYEFFVNFMKNCDNDGNFFISEEVFNMLVEEGKIPFGINYEDFIGFMRNSDNIEQYLFGTED